MFGSTILDVALGLMFAFLMVSLVTSALTETIASAAKWRANTLLQGVKELLNDPQFNGLALSIYNHAAVNARSSGAATTEAGLTARPSYIDAKQFATALIDVAQLLPSATPDALHEKVNAAVPDPQLNVMLNGIVARTGGNINRMRDEIAAWFDGGMDRIAGVYKRKAQLWSFVIALALAVGLNVDTVKIAHALWEQPTIMKGFTPPAGEMAADALKQAHALGIPFGWNADAVGYFQNGYNWIYVLLGWAITAVATLFGAPFWFDALQKFVQLRGAGAK